MTASNCGESDIVEICADYTLMQLVLSPTHDMGNNLDNILSGTSDYQTPNVSVLKNCSIKDHHHKLVCLCDYETICAFREKKFSFNDFNKLSACVSQ